MSYLDWKHRPMPEQSSLQSLQDWIEPQVSFGRIPLARRLQTGFLLDERMLRDKPQRGTKLAQFSHITWAPLQILDIHASILTHL